MCGICQMEFEGDHQELEGPLCPECGRFRRGKDHDPRYENPECYHCFAKAAELEPCDYCAATRN